MAEYDILETRFRPVPRVDFQHRRRWFGNEASSLSPVFLFLVTTLQLSVTRDAAEQLFPLLRSIRYSPLRLICFDSSNTAYFSVTRRLQYCKPSIHPKKWILVTNNSRHAAISSQPSLPSPKCFLAPFKYLCLAALHAIPWSNCDTSHIFEVIFAFQ